MGNELADAIRDELRSAVLDEYGSLEAAAQEMGTPYKTLYRGLTQRGKDRTASVSLDFVLDISGHLASRGNTDLATINARAQARVTNRQRAAEEAS